MRVTISHLIIGTLCSLLSSVAWPFGEGQTGASLETPIPVRIESTALTKPSIQPGGFDELIVNIQIDKGYKAYLDQFKLQTVAPADVYFSELQVLPAETFIDPVTKKPKLGTSGSSKITTLIQLPSSFRPGVYQVKSILTFQACTKDFCLFPQEVPFEFQLNVTGGADLSLTKLLEQGWLYALLIVFVAGFLTSFTPCIFPMIPITLAVIGSHGVGKSRWRGFFISFTYVLGIALTYSVLGVIAAKTGALFGALLGHPLVVTLISILFIILGLSMYGLFELKFPDKWANRLLSRTIDRGYLGAFISGLIAGVVASPCVGPVLVSILTYVAQTQDVTKGFVLLMTFAFGLGQIFIILGTFSQLLHRLPRSGPWMERIKFIFGSTMIGMALYFIYPVAHSSIFDGLIATALILVSSFFGAFDRLRKIDAPHKAWKALMLLIFALGWVFAIKAMIPAHLQEKLFYTSASPSSNYPKPQWYRFSDELLQKAKDEGRPVIIDFHAEWCLACKELEINTFADARVIAEGHKFLWLEFDATKPSAELDELKKRFDIRGLPHVVFFNSQGKWRSDLTLNGFETADDFLKRMRELDESTPP